MNYEYAPGCVVLDVENPNCRNNSVCAVGLLIIREGQITEEKYSLINPGDRFDRRNSEINGITPDMVVNAPTFKEYWAELEPFLTDNIIIGHNITYDLSVISKALDRYDIPVPDFDYICTLELSRSLLKVSSYSLSNLLSGFGITYQAHNALEDAKASFHLLSHLIGKYGTRSVVTKTYRYVPQLKEAIDSRLESNINDLHGIIKGISSDNIIDENEICCLQK